MERNAFNPYPWYKKLSERNPVVYDENFMQFYGTKGGWHVLRYDDVQTILSDYETFSSQVMPQIDENPLTRGIQSSDPPFHRQLRMLVAKAFTPKAINDMKPWIEQITNELIDKIIDRGEMDVTSDIAIPVPIQVIAKMIGVPFEDQAKFKEWSVTILKQPTDEEGVAVFLQCQKEMGAYFFHLIEQRKQQPKDDLVTHLIQAEVDGQKLSANDLLAFLMTLLVAGNETTTNFINNAILTFMEFPEVQEHLTSHPEDIPKALEEVLRYRSPVQYVNRVAAKDVILRGQQIKKGDHINLWIGAANRDESVFPNADQFDFNRTNLKHIAFGHGIHFCIGAPLARLQASIALKIMLERMGQFKLKDNKEPVMNPTVVVYSIKELPVTFQKRK
ncbi:cytochrome P450 [Shimazuella kribbensis]|uniref:cytochrome P450 n=1 Tax=Shimazuella kribbensis TaxID=139808 RepID=UPI00040A56EA|nr:cytochrome P450 [Shimazuella kribbensis]